MAPKKDIKPFELNSKEEDGEPVYIVHYQVRINAAADIKEASEMSKSSKKKKVKIESLDDDVSWCLFSVLIIILFLELKRSDLIFELAVNIDPIYTTAQIRMSETGSRASTPSDRVGSSTRAPSTTSDKASSARPRAAGLTVGSQEVIEPPAAKRRKRDSIVASQDAATATSIDPLTMPGELLRPSKIYGLPHLLRLFARFSSLLRVTPWSERTLNVRNSYSFV
uniref:MRG domain-containing protein n=1 Tax=Heterorhabditis bacteriophora TaxID=37862 RepID=A0A1I7XBP8_HETBA